MFDPEYYPTPPQLISKMLQPFDNQHLDNATILEPSAGSGAILDYIRPRLRKNKKLYCCEHNPELAEILKGKGYRLVAKDFLTYAPQHVFNMIIMNPPFSNGVDHVLHAWQILDSGNIVALLNADTIRNPFSEKRKLLCGLIERHGSFEILSHPFADAERKTNVDVAIVRLFRMPTQSRMYFRDVRPQQKATSTDDDLVQNKVARNDLIESLEQSVRMAKEAAQTMVKAYHQLLFYGSSIDLTYYRTIFEILGAGDSQEKHYNELVDVLNNKAWNKVFDKSHIQNLLTGKMRDDFAKFSEQQGSMEFTQANVNELLDMLINNRGSIMQQAIDDVFESMCKYDKANKVHWEGWKTNSAYKVNRKVIMPHLFGYNNITWSIPWDRCQFLNDVDKCMCWLSGERFDINSPGTIVNTIGNIGMMGRNGRFGEKLESRYFYLRYYQKGTLHFEWIDPKLWERFNRAAAEGKKWLPADTNG